MKWSFTLPGQPPSWNDSYRIVKRESRRGTHMGLAKKEVVTKYQRDAVLIIRSAKPSGWDPAGQVRVSYRFYLVTDIDCDNMMKAIHDVIEMATNVNDKRFLPCVLSKESGLPPSKARVEVELEDIGSLSVGAPDSSTTPSPSSASSRIFQPPRPSSFVRRT